MIRLNPRLRRDKSGGGASRALSRLASVPVRSSTVVHSRTVLGAKHDIAARCIHRVQSNRFMFLTNHNVSDIFQVSP